VFDITGECHNDGICNLKKKLNSHEYIYIYIIKKPIKNQLVRVYIYIYI